MKRMIALLLCLGMVLGMANALAAEPANASFYTQSNNGSGEVSKYVSSAANLGDTVYFSTNTTLESWKPGDAEPAIVFADIDNPDYLDADTLLKDEQSGKPAFNKLFADDTTVYGLNRTTGTVWKLADANGPLAKPEIAVKLDWSKMSRKAEGDEYTYTPQMGDVALVNGVFYMTLSDWNANTPSYELASWTFATGALVEDKADMFLRTLSPYKDGLLIGKYYDEANSWDEKTQTQKMPSLVTYNPAIGETATLMEFESAQIYGVRYSAQKDTLYYVDGSTAYSLPGLQKPAKVSAYLPNRVYEDATCLLLPSGMLVIADYNGLIVRGLDMPGIENGALTIYGEYGSIGHQAYVAAYPQALVTCSENYYSSLEQFTNAMVAGNGAVDVLRLDSDYSPLTRLIEKGYALDLSAYPDLVNLVNSMDPNLTKICMKDGKLYGVPVEMSSSAFGYNKQALEKLGLTEADLPKTFMEFLDFVDNWQYDYGEEHSDLMLLDSGSVKESIINWIMTNYIADLTRKGESITFDTELFRKLMSKVDSIDFSELEAPTDGDKEAYYNRTGLFTMYAGVTYPGQYRYDMKFMPMPMDEGMDPLYPVTLQVMIINPRTTHLEQAVQYLTTYAKNLDPTSAQITLFPANNEPVVNGNFEKDLESWKKSLAESTEQLKTATAEDKANLQANIDYLQGLIDDADTYRYNVTAEEIAAFREKVAPYLIVVGQTPLNTWGEDGTNQFYTLESQYLQGATTLDQFIKEIDKRMRMMQLEDE